MHSEHQLSAAVRQAAQEQQLNSSVSFVASQSLKYPFPTGPERLGGRAPVAIEGPGQAI